MTRLRDSARHPLGPRTVFARKRRKASPWREVLFALLNTGLGAGLLVGLLQLPGRLDSLLIVSEVISTLIAGLSRIGLGVVTLITGVAQMLGILILLALAISALLLLGNGVYRLVRLALPGVGGALMVPGRCARLVWSVVRIRPSDRSER